MAGGAEGGASDLDRHYTLEREIVALLGGVFDTSRLVLHRDSNPSDPRIRVFRVLLLSQTADELEQRCSAHLRLSRHENISCPSH
jgi:hypothetical protein